MGLEKPALVMLLEREAELATVEALLVWAPPAMAPYR